MADSFVFYKSFYNAIKEFDNDTIAEFFKLVCQYALDGEIIETDNKVAKALFQMTIPQIEANNKRRENGKKGGAPTGNNNAKKTTEKQPKNNQKQPKVDLKNNPKQPNVNVNDNELLSNSKELSNNKKEDVITSSKKDESSVNLNLQNYADSIMRVENNNWRDVMSKKFKIEDFERATEDYRDWLIGTTFSFQVNNLEDYKRIFCYNAKKFLSDDALKQKPIKPIVINGVEYS